MSRSPLAGTGAAGRTLASTLMARTFLSLWMSPCPFFNFKIFCFVFLFGLSIFVTSFHQKQALPPPPKATNTFQTAKTPLEAPNPPRQALLHTASRLQRPRGADAALQLHGALRPETAQQADALLKRLVRELMGRWMGGFRLFLFEGGGGKKVLDSRPSGGLYFVRCFCFRGGKDA